jgi:hypothetical protein
MKDRTLKPFFTAARKKIAPEKLGLPSEKSIKNSVYSKCGNKK